jgi:enamine deaminase RidA (YjgF/YER057c/UK114 family)
VAVPPIGARGSLSTREMRTAGVDMNIQRFNPESLGVTYGRYSNVARVKASELIFIAGQVGVHADGSIPQEFSAQCELTFENIRRGLESCGATWANVVQFTTYLVDPQHITLFNEFREREFPRLFPRGDFPCNTLLIINRLVKESLLFEVQTVACL